MLVLANINVIQCILELCVFADRAMFMPHCTFNHGFTCFNFSMHLLYFRVCKNTFNKVAQRAPILIVKELSVSDNRASLNFKRQLLL